MASIAFLLFSAAVAVAFMVGSLWLMHLGRRIGAKHHQRAGDSAFKGLSTPESAVFALMGLLLAFAISGALQRFDERKQLILREANAIATASERLDLLPTEVRQPLKTTMREYIKARLELYTQPIAFSLQQGNAVFSSAQEKKIAEIQSVLWRDAVQACSPPVSVIACSLVLPGLNVAFEAARTRAAANERHPPHIIFVMLFGLGLGASLLAGFSMAASHRSWLHMMIFAGALALVFFVVTDLEFPRLGLLRVDGFDHFMTELLERP